MNRGLVVELEHIEREKGIKKEILLEAVESAMASAVRKNIGDKMAEVEVKIDPETGDFKVKVDGKKVDAMEFGRIAAQTAKQVIIQRIREAEKEKAFEEFSQKQGDLITGTVQRKEGRAYLINLGRTEALLVPQEQIRGETFRIKDHVKLYVTEVKRTPKGPLVMVSRNHPGLVEKLFGLEIPEISQGVLEVKGLAREAGRRTKIAVFSNDKNVTAIGTCVGHMGNRIQNIVRELGNERVDIIEWKKDPKAFITNALSPAKITKVNLKEEGEEKLAQVIVPDNQLSLAIGKEGQNVRLASKLTGWKIDISSEEESAGKDSDKSKIHEIAKETGLTSKEIIEKLKALKIEAKAATSSISLEDKQKLLGSLDAKEDKKSGKKEEPEKGSEEKPDKKE